MIRILHLILLSIVECAEYNPQNNSCVISDIEHGWVEPNINVPENSPIPAERIKISVLERRFGEDRCLIVGSIDLSVFRIQNAGKAILAAHPSSAYVTECLEKFDLDILCLQGVGLEFYAGVNETMVRKGMARVYDYKYLDPEDSGVKLSMIFNKKRLTWLSSKDIDFLKDPLHKHIVKNSSMVVANGLSKYDPSRESDTGFMAFFRLGSSTVIGVMNLYLKRREGLMHLEDQRSNPYKTFSDEFSAFQYIRFKSLIKEFYKTSTEYSARNSRYYSFVAGTFNLYPDEITKSIPHAALVGYRYSKIKGVPKSGWKPDIEFCEKDKFAFSDPYFNTKFTYIDKSKNSAEFRAIYSYMYSSTSAKHIYTLMHRPSSSYSKLTGACIPLMRCEAYRLDNKESGWMGGQGSLIQEFD